MGLFRGSGRSGIDVKQFGVGSIFWAGENQMFLLIAASNQSEVAVVNLTTYAVTGFVRVADVDHLSENEMREVVNKTGLDYAFSDFEFNNIGAAGIKRISVKHLKSVL